MKKIAALLFALAAPLSAQALDSTEVKDTHIKNCVANGGDRSICICSYDKAISMMTVEQLAMVNSQMSNRDVVDEQLAGKLEHATSECADEVRAKKISAALPPPPPPPPLPTLDPIPAKETIKVEDKTYFEDIKKEPIPTVKPAMTIDAEEEALDKEFTDKKIAANKAGGETETYSSKEEVYIEPAKPKRPAGYFGEYDKRFFNAIATGNGVEIRAYSTRVYDFDVKNQDGDTALIVAIVNGQAPSVSYLITKGANVNAKNSRGQAPIHVASYMRRPDIVQLLIDAKADVNAAYGVGFTPLTLAIMQQDVETVNLLLKAKAKLNKALADGNNELHIAAAGTEPAMVDLLVKAGAKVNARNKAGYTPLMVAAYTGNTSVAERLIINGADVSLKDSAGRNAITLANAAGKMDTVNMLMAYQK